MFNNNVASYLFAKILCCKYIVVYSILLLTSLLSNLAKTFPEQSYEGCPVMLGGTDEGVLTEHRVVTILKTLKTRNI